MIFLHVDPTTKNTKLFNKHIKHGKNVYVLFYLEGCGPCNATRPEWEKIKNVLSEKYKYDDSIVIADVDQSVMKELLFLKSEPKGFPCMRFISKKGKESEDYEDSNISKKDRTIDSFVEWIESKIKKQHKPHNIHKGGKWSAKYKRSINCRRPKGFSQKQHCKYGRKTNKNRSKRIRK
jgi:thiol-disulfide isomerase/thioredoxin